MRIIFEIELDETPSQISHLAETLECTLNRFLAGQDGPEIRDIGKIKDVSGRYVGLWEVKA